MSKSVIQRIGETDQMYLEANSAELALERGQLRLTLVELSQHKSEKIHFLHEAIALLEQARIEFEDIDTSLYVDLSLALAHAYMLYYELTHDIKFATITQQILKPLAHLKQANVYLILAYACKCKKELALTRHWLSKYLACTNKDLEMLLQHSAFQVLKDEIWFKELIHEHLS
ncbi:hypothetical protein [Acinetobacter boissieri]|uniref:Uncharacterized protein n=1 Tax=Acinetobacter boissieri TaxID=1219383 RepID=A0A1G6HSM3_9GAMM|nr:hypothetical protein [Acinetobacter boissieri]SDB97231.1 hypothetical protein SAMN05421733_1074 [Acinetobacter boissieri]